MFKTNTRKVGLVCGAAALALVATMPLRAKETLDYDSINKIKQQGLNAATSQVMEISSWLTDVYGPRLTGSPNIKKAGEWAVAKMKEWGLANVDARAVAADPAGNNGFPRGWANEKFYMAAVSPQAFPIPGTPTVLDARHQRPRARRGRAGDGDDAEELKAKHPAGKLKGKWMLRAAAPDVAAYWTAPAQRYTKEQLETHREPEASA